MGDDSAHRRRDVDHRHRKKLRCASPSSACFLEECRLVQESSLLLRGGYLSLNTLSKTINNHLPATPLASCLVSNYENIAPKDAFDNVTTDDDDGLDRKLISTMSAARQRLPTVGEIVIIDGLVSKPELNGKRGQILRYDKELHRYPIRLRLDDGKKKILSIKPQNISLLPTGVGMNSFVNVFSV